MHFASGRSSTFDLTLFCRSLLTTSHVYMRTPSHDTTNAHLHIPSASNSHCIPPPLQSVPSCRPLPLYQLAQNRLHPRYPILWELNPVVVPPPRVSIGQDACTHYHAVPSLLRTRIRMAASLTLLNPVHSYSSLHARQVHPLSPNGSCEEATKHIFHFPHSVTSGLSL